MGECSALAGQGHHHVFGLQALVALHDRELYALAFDQNAVALAADGAEHLLPRQVGAVVRDW